MGILYEVGKAEKYPIAIAREKSLLFSETMRLVHPAFSEAKPVNYSTILKEDSKIRFGNRRISPFEDVRDVQEIPLSDVETIKMLLNRYSHKYDDGFVVKTIDQELENQVKQALREQNIPDKKITFKQKDPVDPYFGFFKTIGDQCYDILKDNRKKVIDLENRFNAHYLKESEYHRAIVVGKETNAVFYSVGESLDTNPYYSNINSGFRTLVSMYLHLAEIATNGFTKNLTKQGAKRLEEMNRILSRINFCYLSDLDREIGIYAGKRHIPRKAILTPPGKVDHKKYEFVRSKGKGVAGCPGGYNIANPRGPDAIHFGAIVLENMVQKIRRMKRRDKVRNEVSVSMREGTFPIKFDFNN